MILINEGGVDYEERNYMNSWVPLHEAAFHNSVACVQVLLDCGAPLRPRTDQGKTPLVLAEEVPSNDVLALLRDYVTPPARSHRIDWLHDVPKFDRLAAKHCLESVRDGSCNGMFVVRRSSKNAKNYALTLFHEREIFNFEIICVDARTFHIDDGPFFDSLEHLVDHYCRIPDGLPTTLTCSVDPAGQVIRSRVQPFSRLQLTNRNKGKSEGMHGTLRFASFEYSRCALVRHCMSDIGEELGRCSEATCLRPFG